MRPADRSARCARFAAADAQAVSRQLENDIMQASRYLSLTKEYYAHWLSVSPSLLNRSGIYSQFSPERDRQQEGYSECFDFYGYFSGETAILSYGSQLRDEIDWISDFLMTKRDFQEFEKLVQNRFGIQPHIDYKYYFDHLVSSRS